MAGLPHYKNSQISMNKWEPVYTNLFDVSIILPEAISSEPKELLIEEITKIGGLEVDKVPPAEVEQIFKGWKRRYANAFVADSTVNLTIDFQVNLNDSNSAFAYKTLRRWCDLIFDPLTASMMLKKDYTGGPMTISLYNRRGDVWRQYIMPVIWPTTSITPIDLDYSTGSGKWEMAGMTFASDYWEDMAL